MKKYCLILIVLLVTGCGQSGPLYLPEPVLQKKPSKITQTAVPSGTTSQNQTIQSEQPYTAPNAQLLLPKELN